MGLLLLICVFTAAIAEHEHFKHLNLEFVDQEAHRLSQVPQ
jgi:hypothetical protein